jgi:hypothetical protein
VVTVAAAALATSAAYGMWTALEIAASRANRFAYEHLGAMADAGYRRAPL